MKLLQSVTSPGFVSSVFSSDVKGLLYTSLMSSVAVELVF